MTRALSNCCNAEITVGGESETHYYVCTACNNACDFHEARAEKELEINDGKCFICGELTNSLAGNPSVWGFYFPHIDGSGKHRHYHLKCLYPILTDAYPAPRVGEWEKHLYTAIDKVCSQYDILNKSRTGCVTTIQLALSEAIKPIIRSLLSRQPLRELEESELAKVISAELIDYKIPYGKEYKHRLKNALIKAICQRFGTPKTKVKLPPIHGETTGEKLAKEDYLAELRRLNPDVEFTEKENEK